MEVHPFMRAHLSPPNHPYKGPTTYNCHIKGWNFNTGDTNIQVTAPENTRGTELLWTFIRNNNLILNKLMVMF